MLKSDFIFKCGDSLNKCETLMYEIIENYFFNEDPVFDENDTNALKLIHQYPNLMCKIDMVFDYLQNAIGVIGEYKNDVSDGVAVVRSVS